MSRNTSMSFLLLSGLGLLSACGGDDKPAETGGAGATQCPPGQYFDGRFCQTQGVAPGGTAPAGTATAPAGTTPPGGVALPPGTIATAAAGPTATPLDPTAAQAAT